MNIEPLASIDKSTYGTIVAAGIIGAATVAVEFVIVIGGVVKQVIIHIGIPHLATKFERRQNRKTALRNLQTPRPEFVTTLRYLKAHNLKRFPAPAPWRNHPLQNMVQSFVIEIDDPNYKHRAADTYYSVPDCVWKWLEHVEPDYASTPVLEDPPWQYPTRRR
jgi:hypothetical protein